MMSRGHRTSIVDPLHRRLALLSREPECREIGVLVRDDDERPASSARDESHTCTTEVALAVEHERRAR